MPYNLKNKPKDFVREKIYCGVSGCGLLVVIRGYRKDGSGSYHPFCAHHMREKYGITRDKWGKIRKRWFHTSPVAKLQKIRNSNKRRRKLLYDIDTNEFVEWFKKHRGRCEYCGMELDKETTNGIEIDRKNSELGYTMSNIAVSCYSCNVSKNNLFTFEEFKEIAKRYNLKERNEKRKEETNSYRGRN